MTKWSDETKAVAYQAGIARTERELLLCLATGASGSAKELCAIMAARRRENGFVWFALLNLERSGLAYRNYDCDDWRTYHRWKITGCGLLAAAPRP